VLRVLTFGDVVGGCTGHADGGDTSTRVYPSASQALRPLARGGPYEAKHPALRHFETAERLLREEPLYTATSRSRRCAPRCVYPSASLLCTPRCFALAFPSAVRCEGEGWAAARQWRRVLGCAAPSLAVQLDLPVRIAAVGIEVQDVEALSQTAVCRQRSMALAGLGDGIAKPQGSDARRCRNPGSGCGGASPWT
jgi:hypothetical protein